MKLFGMDFPEIAVCYTDDITLDDLLGLGREIRAEITSGLPVAITRDLTGAVVDASFMSPCCTAAVTYPGDGGGLCCKKCWEFVDPALDQLIDPAKVTAV